MDNKKRHKNGSVVHHITSRVVCFYYNTRYLLAEHISAYVFAFSYTAHSHYLKTPKSGAWALSPS